MTEDSNRCHDEVNLVCVSVEEFPNRKLCAVPLMQGKKIPVFFLRRKPISLKKTHAKKVSFSPSESNSDYPLWDPSENAQMLPVAFCAPPALCGVHQRMLDGHHGLLLVFTREYSDRRQWLHSLSCAPDICLLEFVRLTANLALTVGFFADAPSVGASAPRQVRGRGHSVGSIRECSDGPALVPISDASGILSTSFGVLPSVGSIRECSMDPHWYPSENAQMDASGPIQLSCAPDIFLLEFAARAAGGGLGPTRRADGGRLWARLRVGGRLDAPPWPLSRFIAPSLPIRVDQAVMQMAPPRRPPPPGVKCA